MTGADRFGDEPVMAFDPEQPDVGWYIAEPLPLHDEPSGCFPRWLRRLLGITV